MAFSGLASTILLLSHVVIYFGATRATEKTIDGNDMAERVLEL
jgi:hypothetical protein